MLTKIDIATAKKIIEAKKLVSRGHDEINNQTEGGAKTICKSSITEDSQESNRNTIAKNAEVNNEMESQHNNGNHESQTGEHSTERTCVTLDEFLNMNKDVFGDNIDVQGVVEVPRQVIANQLRRKPKFVRHITKVARANTNINNLEKLRKQGVIVKKSVKTHILKKPIGIQKSVNLNMGKRHNLNKISTTATSHTSKSNVQHPASTKIINKIMPVQQTHTKPTITMNKTSELKEVEAKKEQDGYFSCFKKPKESLIPVSDIPDIVSSTTSFSVATSSNNVAVSPSHIMPASSTGAVHKSPLRASLGNKFEIPKKINTPHRKGPITIAPGVKIQGISNSNNSKKADSVSIGPKLVSGIKVMGLAPDERSNPSAIQKRNALSGPTCNSTTVESKKSQSSPLEALEKLKKQGLLSVIKKPKLTDSDNSNSLSQNEVNILSVKEG